MKIFFLFLLFSSLSYAQTWELSKGTSTYEVNHTLKRVTGESKELKGKIQCGPRECEFLLAAPIKSWVSNDSNRDDNMQRVSQAVRFPHAIARGKIQINDLLNPKKMTLPVEIEFHGKKAIYQADMDMKQDGLMNAKMTLLLDTHGVERPSLFGMKIDNEVPLQFEMHWIKK